MGWDNINCSYMSINWCNFSLEGSIPIGCGFSYFDLFSNDWSIGWDSYGSCNDMLYICVICWWPCWDCGGYCNLLIWRYNGYYCSIVMRNNCVLACWIIWFSSGNNSLMWMKNFSCWDLFCVCDNLWNICL